MNFYFCAFFFGAILGPFEVLGKAKPDPDGDILFHINGGPGIPLFVPAGIKVILYLHSVMRLDIDNLYT